MSKHREGQRNGVILACAAFGALFIAMTMFFAHGYFQGVRYEKQMERLIASKNPELVSLRKLETETLGAYAWRDREAGVVRIPIERAMNLLVQERGVQGGQVGQ